MRCVPGGDCRQPSQPFHHDIPSRDRGIHRRLKPLPLVVRRVPRFAGDHEAFECREDTGPVRRWRRA
jgi:hypothetical protein